MDDDIDDKRAEMESLFHFEIVVIKVVECRKAVDRLHEDYRIVLTRTWVYEHLSGVRSIRLRIRASLESAYFYCRPAESPKSLRWSDTGWMEYMRVRVTALQWSFLLSSF